MQTHDEPKKIAQQLGIEQKKLAGASEAKLQIK